MVVIEQKLLLLYMEQYFSQLKSYLDILAKTLAKFFDIKNVITFAKKGNAPGGRFIEILKNNTPAKHKTLADIIVKIIIDHKPLWIDFSIRHRDTISHYKTLQSKISINTSQIQRPVSGFYLTTFFEGKPLHEMLINIGNYFEVFNTTITTLLKSDFECSD